MQSPTAPSEERDAYGKPRPAAVMSLCDEYAMIKRADAEAIAKAPEHVAALLAEVKRLREENAKLRGELAEVREEWRRDSAIASGDVPD